MSSTQKVNGNLDVAGSLSVDGTDGFPGLVLVQYTEANKASISRPSWAKNVLWVSADATSAPTNADTSDDIVSYP